MQGTQGSFFLLLLLITKIAAYPPIAKHNCTDYCGNVRIPYPFGIGEGCYYPGFEIFCDKSLSRPSAWLTSIEMEVVGISLERSYRRDYYYDDTWMFLKRSYRRYYYYGEDQYVTVKTPIAFSQNCIGRETGKLVNLTGSPFFLSATNAFIAAGCKNRAVMTGTGPAIVGCRSSCGDEILLFGPGKSCDSGETCCSDAIPSGLQEFNASFETEKEAGGCQLAFLLEEEWFDSINETDPSTLQDFMDTGYVHTRLIWRLIDYEMTESSPERTCTEGYEPNSTVCRCADGYEGNAYLPNGCQDVDECMRYSFNPCGKATCVNTYGSHECQRRKFWVILGISIGLGVLLLFIAGWWLYKFLKKRRQIKQKKKFFKRNGGLLLEQQMFPREGGGIENTKIFDSKELDMATDHFNKNRVLGQGGQGTVFKGMLVDGRIVAVKKSKVVDADKVEEFINEVVILSQINHRNVVKLLGCCLETEVPLLVYEFIPNGTLFHYLHDPSEEFQLSFEMRLRIAKEVAEALFYLHSCAAIPIYHRDIKSTNILLNEKYRAKVSDFGTSRSVAIDQTHLTATNVQGTFGYLDPEYFQSSQFTDKSDVYSFGVVLAELITGEKPISLVREQEQRSLATLFILSMEENQLFDIVDSRIRQGSRVQEEIVAVAQLAYCCLNLSGKKRPTMREVAIELERISALQKATNVQEKLEEVEYAISDVSYTWNTTSTSTGLGFDTGDKASLEMEMEEPFIFSQ